MCRHAFFGGKYLDYYQYTACWISLNPHKKGHRNIWIPTSDTQSYHRAHKQSNKVVVSEAINADSDVGHISTVGQTKKEQTVRLSETLNQGNTEEYLNVTDFDPQLSLIKLQSQTMSMSPTDITWHPTNRPGFMTAGLGVKFKVKQFKSRRDTNVQ